MFVIHALGKVRVKNNSVINSETAAQHMDPVVIIQRAFNIYSRRSTCLRGGSFCRCSGSLSLSLFCRLRNQLKAVVCGSVGAFLFLICGVIV